MNNEKSKKMPIIISVVVLCIIALLIVGGYFFQVKSPEKIFELVIGNFANDLIEYVDTNMPDKFDFKQNDIRMSGKFTVDTDFDLQEFNSLKDFIYHYQMDVSFRDEIIKLGFSMDEDLNEILSAKVIFQDSNGYVSIPGVLPTLLNIGEVESLPFKTSGQVVEKEKYKKLIEKMKMFFIQTLDKSKFSKNDQVVKNFRGEEIATTESVYLLDEENQLQTLQKLKNQMLDDSEFIQICSAFSGLSEEDVRKNIEKSFEKFSYKNDLSLVISMKGNDFFGFEVVQGEEIEFSYFENEDDATIKFDEFEIDITKENDRIVFYLDQEDFEVKFNLYEMKLDKNKYSSKFDLEFMDSQNHLKLSYDGVIDYAVKVEKENISSSKKMEDFSESEQGEILRNFLKKIQGTSLENLISYFMVGLV